MHFLQKLDTATEDWLCIVFAGHKADNMLREAGKSGITWILDCIWLFRAPGDHYPAHILQCLCHFTQVECLCTNTCD